MPNSVFPVLIPGMICSSWAYRRQLDALGARIINLNEPARYAAPHVMSIRRLGEDILDEIEQLSEGKPILMIGHSMGGYLILELLRIMRERRFDLTRVRGIGILSATLGSDSPERRRQRLAQIDAIERGEFHSLVEELLGVWFSSRFLLAPGAADVVDAVRAELLNHRSTYETVFRAQCHVAMSRPDYGAADDLELLPSCPIGFLWGQEDELFDGREIIKTVRRRAPKATTVLVRGAGHMVTVEKPQEVCRFLARLSNVNTR